MWGSRHADFQGVAGRLNGSIVVPSVDRVQVYLEQNPFVARWADEINRRHAMLDLEVSRSVPDVRLSGGWRRFEETDSSAMVAYLTVPLQVFDRNDGNIAAAERRIARAEQEARNARNSLDAQLVQAIGALSVAAAQIGSLEREVLPAAEGAAEKTQAGYSDGRFDLLSVLDSQRTLIEVRLELVNAKAEFEKAKVQVEAIVGRDLAGL
jgi:cobalt-zinc-cadmium efflux system outer membrane protein